MPVPPAESPFTHEIVHLLPSICVHTPVYGTRSSTVLALSPGRVEHYLYADGPPREAALSDFTELPMRHLVAPLVLSLSLYACGSDSERAPSGLEADPFVPMSDEALTARIQEARREASASERRVLLDFIADWCEDCREVVRLSHEEPARGVIEESYVVVYVEVGRFDRHRALIAEHQIDRIAALVVLDPETGRRVAKTTLEPITGGQRGFTSAALAAWLRNPT